MREQAKEEEEDKDMPFIRANPKAAGPAPGLVSEVQQAMDQAVPFLQQNQKEWMNEDLLKTIAENPFLAKCMAQPQFMQAVGEFQRDPAGAKKKYADSPDMMRFFKEFFGIMGAHFTNLADKKDATNDGGKKQQSSSSQSSTSSVFSSSSMMTPTTTTTTTTTSKEQAEVNRVLQNPEVVAALQDPGVKRLLEALRAQQHPAAAQAMTAQAMRDPSMRAKLAVLFQNGLLGVSQ